VSMTSDGLRLRQNLRRWLLGLPRQLRPRRSPRPSPTINPETVSTVA
jgi:hypothetical protein